VSDIESEDDLWEDPEAAEYCSEACYHDWLCDELEEEMDPGLCVDLDCYYECLRNYHGDP